MSSCWDAESVFVFRRPLVLKQAGMPQSASPANLGTIIRTAEAAGAGGIFLLGPECTLFEPATARATMGSLFSQKVIRCSPQELRAWAKSNGVVVVASSPAGSMNYKDFRYRFPPVLAIGSQKCGLSDQLLEAADIVVRIPTSAASRQRLRPNLRIANAPAGHNGAGTLAIRR